MISPDAQVRATASTDATAAAAGAGAGAAKPPACGGFSFHSVLSAMNPLQYLPVVGPLYRALTGDVIPEAVRDGGSMLVSGLLGGPVGLITNLAVTLGEKITGIDPEKIVAAQLHPVAPAAPARTPLPPAATAGAPVPTDVAPVALSTAQLAEYGVQSDASGTLKLGDVEGADVLNTVELIQLGKAAAAYAANQRLAAPKSG